MAKNLLSAARIAEITGISRQAVTKKCNKDFARAKDGKKWNVNHARLGAWLKEKGVTASDLEGRTKSANARIDKRATTVVSQSRSKMSTRAVKKSVPEIESPLSCAIVGYSENGVSDELPDINDLMGMTLREIALHHGTVDEFRPWADAFLKVQNGIEKELKNKKLKGEVIEREFVRSHVFGLLHEMNSRILVDYPRKLVEIVYAHCQAEDSKEEAEMSVRNELSKPIKSAKEQVIKRIGAENE